MKKCSTIVVLAAVLAASVVASASAATLSATGSVQVNRGSGFQPVSGMVEVRGGDRVLVGAGGTARIAYADGCATSVRPNSLAVVATSAPCSGQMNQQGSLKDAPQAVHGVDPLLLTLGTGAVVATVLVATNAFRSSSSPRVSP